MIAWETVHASLRSLPQTQYKIPPLVHQSTYPNGRIGSPSPYLGNILRVRKLISFSVYMFLLKGSHSGHTTALENIQKHAWQAARYDHYKFLLLSLLYSPELKGDIVKRRQIQDILCTNNTNAIKDNRMYISVRAVPRSLQNLATCNIYLQFTSS